MILNNTTILAVASDFDGTIIKEGMTEPPGRFYEVVDRLLSLNIPFIAASGRQYGNLKRLLGPHADRVSYISENGCLVVHEGRVIHKTIFDRTLAMELIADMQKHKDGEIMVSGENTSYLVTDNTGYIDMLKNRVKHNVMLLERFEDIPEDILKISIYWETGIPTEPEKWFHDKYDSRLKVVNGGNGWLDFNAINSGKGEALQVLADYMNIPIDNIVAFGDNENDLTMLKKAGIGYAVASSMPHIRAQADYICESVEDTLLEALS